MKTRVLRIAILAVTFALVSTFSHSANAARRHHHHHHGGAIGRSAFAPRVYVYPSVPGYGFGGSAYGGYAAPHHHHHHHHHHGW